MASYVGLDVSLAETNVCVLGDRGEVRFEGKARSRPEDLAECIRKHAGDAERVGLETGQTAGVLVRALKEAGLPVVCLETRHAHKALSARVNKTDRNDARGLAELMRVGWYREAWVRGASAHAVRCLLLGMPSGPTAPSSSGGQPPSPFARPAPSGGASLPGREPALTSKRSSRHKPARP